MFIPTSSWPAASAAACGRQCRGNIFFWSRLLECDEEHQGCGEAAAIGTRILRMEHKFV